MKTGGRPSFSSHGGRRSVVFEAGSRMVPRIGVCRRAEGPRASGVGLLMASTALAGAFAGLVAPQASRAQSAPEIRAAQSDDRRTFSVPAGPLANALTIFGRQAGLQVSVDPAIVQGISSPGVSGTLSIALALARLLAGTGLAHRIVGNTVTLQKPGASSGVMQLDPVQVQGYPVPAQAMIDNLPPPYAGGQVATGGQLGLLGNRSVMDTPFNQTSYTAKKAQDQQAQTIKDVLIDDPSVRAHRTDGTPGGDSVNIRGFDLASVSYGGLYGILPSFSIMAELAERVEVLKGPSVLLNGMTPAGDIGGTINIVPKRAPDEGLTQVTAGYVSSGQLGGHADIGYRFGPDKEVGVRFNGVFAAGPTDVQWNTDQRSLAVLGLDFRGTRVRLSADLGYQFQFTNGVTPYLGLANGVPLPWAPDVRSNPGGQPWSYQGRKDLFGVVRGEIDLTEHVTAYAAFGAHDFRIGGLYPTFITVTNFNGAATSSNSINYSQYRTYLTGDAGLRAAVDTGPIGHGLAVTATTYTENIGGGPVAGTPFTRTSTIQSSLRSPIFQLCRRTRLAPPHCRASVLLIPCRPPASASN
ncbi:MAG: TonB-dependent receptor plug domain-containing protein [Rhodospirillales bacterium]|nr:TonB-dependent receptor plug domain-containing protein [Rhodospirillales bacterium]